MRIVYQRFVSAVLALFAADAFAQAGVDVNDVSVLFPLSESLQMYPNIALEDGQLLNPGLTSAVMDHAKKLGIKSASANNLASSSWRVMGFRYDPCASDNLPGTVVPCIQELRLIAQPISADGPEDSALHMIYRLGEGDLTPDDPALIDLLRTKSEAEKLTMDVTAGKALQVHPLLAAGMASKFPLVGELYKAFVLKYATADRLKKITMMGLKDAAITNWIFFGGKVQDGQWAIDIIPNLPEESASFVQLNKATNGVPFTPLPVDNDFSTAIYFNKRVPTAAELDAVQKNIERIDDLDQVNRNNTDCLSCHSATTLRVTPRLNRFLDATELGLSVPQGITAFPAPRILQNHMFHWNLRAFGYFGTFAAMNLRAVMESGRAADRINKIMQLTNPGLDCSAHAKDVMVCLIKSSTPFSEEEAGKTCLDLCQAP